MTAGELVAVYDWGEWSTSLAAAILPRARRLGAVIGEHHGDVLARLPARARWLLFHVDLTDSARLPMDRAALVARLAEAGISVLNGAAIDISKRAVQAACAACGLPSVATTAEEGSPDELLIVKSNLNFGGETEAQLGPAERARLGLAAAAAPAPMRIQYPVRPREELPPGLWSDPAVVIERFIANDECIFFRAYLLGERMVISAAVHYLAVKRMNQGLARQQFYFRAGAPIEVPDRSRRVLDALPPELPDQVARLARHLGIDYGAIDFVMDDARRCYAIDVNTTPAWGNTKIAEIPAFLGAAIEDPGRGD